MYLFQLCVWCRLFVLMIDLHSTMYLFQLSRKLFVDFLPLFTFHYVSISTLSFPESTDAVKHLHSTMYLFQPEPIYPKVYHYSHLHSTMYLFQQALTRYNAMITARFTFHYVSISTINCFHRSCNIFVIYIPLCIYFNVFFMNDVRLVIRFTFHYVSISTRQLLAS